MKAILDIMGSQTLLHNLWALYVHLSMGSIVFIATYMFSEVQSYFLVVNIVVIYLYTFLSCVQWSVSGRNRLYVEEVSRVLV